MTFHQCLANKSGTVYHGLGQEASLCQDEFRLNPFLRQREEALGTGLWPPGCFALSWSMPGPAPSVHLPFQQKKRGDKTWALTLTQLAECDCFCFLKWQGYSAPLKQRLCQTVTGSTPVCYQDRGDLYKVMALSRLLIHVKKGGWGIFQWRYFFLITSPVGAHGPAVLRLDANSAFAEPCMANLSATVQGADTDML